MGLSTGNNTGATATVDTPSSAYKATEESRQLIRTLMGGTAAMRAAGETYLPKYPRESDDKYQYRLATAALTNVLADAIGTVVSRPFAKPVQVNPEAPDEVKGWLDDIDLAGSNSTQFAKACFEDAVQDGLVHVLVDYRGAPEAKTLADEKKAGVRPYLTRVPHGNLIAAYRQTVDGKPYVTHARIYEAETRRDGFAEVAVERIRVYEPFRVDVWEKTAKTGKWEVVETREFQFPFVPLYTFYTGKPKADFVVDPPFLDLGHMNVKHWQTASAYDNNLDHCNFSMLAVEPVDGASSPVESLRRDSANTSGSEALEVGPDTVLVGKWYYVEPNAAGLKETADRLEKLKADMRLLGLDPLVPRQTGGVSATERAIDESKAQAQAVEWVTNFGGVLDKALEFAMFWHGVKGTAKLTINTEFQLMLDSQDMAQLIAMRDRRDLSQETLWDEAKRRGLLSPKFDADHEKARIELEAPEFGSGDGGDVTADDDPNATPVGLNLGIKGRSAGGIAITN